MTRKQLSDALGEINLCYVEEALAGPARPAVKRKRGFRAVLAAAVIGILLLPAGAVFLLRPVLQTYFGESACYVYQKNSQILNLSQTTDGWTMTLTDCIGDDNFLYMGIEVTAPQGTVLDATGDSATGPEVAQAFPLPYSIEEVELSVASGIQRPMGWYINQVPDDSATDNHLRFVLWMNCQESLDGAALSLTLGGISHGNGTSDFDGSWTFQDIKLDLADQSIRLTPNVPVPVLDTTATLTELSVSPVSITATFQGEGLIGQTQRYPNGLNITAPTLVLYDQEGHVMELDAQYAPFGSRAGSGSNNETGELRIVQSYETFIDLDALDHIEVCGVSVPIKR